MEPDAFTRQPVGGRLKSDWLLRQVCFWTKGTTRGITGLSSRRARFTGKEETAADACSVAVLLFNVEFAKW